MNTELSLARRVAVHRALGDPGRLALVDALALGDAAPSRLRELVGMSSNLLAHHVDVLVRAGVVRRVRSEGDRRRSYLTLEPGALDGLVTGRAQPASRVVFVCTENAARSPLAAAVWTDLSPVPADSAGTHPAARFHPGAVAVARRHGLALPARPPQQLPAAPAEGDLVITVCDRAHEELPGEQPHWSIPDPARLGTEAAFDAAFAQLRARITRLAPTIRTGGAT